MTDKNLKQNRLPKGWEIKKLKEIAYYFIGLTYSPKDVSDKGIIVLRSSNVQNGKLDFADIVRVNRPVKDSLKVKDGDILMCSRNGSKRLVGKTATIQGLKEEMTFGTFMTVIRSEYNSYLSWFLISDEFREQIGGGENPMINQITKYMLDEIEIPLPPLPEQLRIVSILDEAFAAIATAKANAEQNLKNAKELFDSYLQNIFENKGEGWEEKALGELGTITSSKRIYKSEYVKDGIPFYRTKEIKELSHGKDITLELFISRDRYNEIRKSFGVPKINDLLMSAVGTIGEILVIEDENEFYFKDGNIVWLKDFKSLDTNYLKFALTAFVEKIKNLAQGAAYSALTIEKLNKYKVSYPKTIAEQKSVIQKLDALSIETKRLDAIYRQKLVDLEELKKSVLQKAFSGELTIFKPN
jgi:type I restriction enzyme S subunit